MSIADLTIDPSGMSVQILDSDRNLLATLNDVDAMLIDSSDFVTVQKS